MSANASFADGGPIRARWLDPKAAREEVVRFGRRFGPEAFLLATHVALPLVLTPELVHLIRVNFLGPFGVPAVAEVDLLLSPLCRPLDEPMYEMEPQVRDVLLETLREEFGDVRLAELVEFLLAYRRETPEAEQSADEAEAHKWVTDAWLEPADTMENLSESLETGGAETPLARAQRLRVAVLAESLAGLLAAREAERIGEFLGRSRKVAQALLENGGERSKAGSADVRADGSGEGGTELVPGHVIRIPVEKYGLEFEFAWIPPGKFWMGQTAEETKLLIEVAGEEKYQKFFARELPRHRVALTRGFYMQTTPVTVAQWKAFHEATGYRTEAEREDGAYGWTGSEWKKQKGVVWKTPGFAQTDDHPVTCVSWNDVSEFLKWIGEDYRLPTEAEWEYACRAGTEGAFWTGRCLGTDQANYDGNYPLEGCPKGEYRETTTPVNTFSPNPWGLHDMHGNVWEWCSDWFGGYPDGPATDPTGPESGVLRVARGGSWDGYARYCRSAYRSGGKPEDRNYYLGFRLVRLPGR